MVLMDIHAVFEQRKSNINKILNNGHKLSESKVIELKGAVNEIDVMLQTLEYFNKQVPKPGLINNKQDSEPKSKFFRKRG